MQRSLLPVSCHQVPPKLYECKECSVNITVLDNVQQYAAEAERLMERYNRDSDLTKGFKVEKVTKVLLAESNRTGYFIEFTIKETMCLKAKFLSQPSECKFLPDEYAHTGFCSGKILNDTTDTEVVEVKSCEIFDIQVRGPFVLIRVSSRLCRAKGDVGAQCTGRMPVHGRCMGMAGVFQGGGGSLERNPTPGDVATPTMILENTVTAAVLAVTDVITDIIILTPTVYAAMLLGMDAGIIFRITTTILSLIVTDIHTAVAVAQQVAQVNLIPPTIVKKKTIPTFLLRPGPITLRHPQVAHTTFLLVDFPRHQLGLPLLLQKGPVFVHRAVGPVVVTAITTGGTRQRMNEKTAPQVRCNPPRLSLRPWLVRSIASSCQAYLMSSKLLLQSSLSLYTTNTRNQLFSLSH
uniref:Uncharacterized protein n=1 Tax=Sphaerodactylus townsendi TaxID=933632 RepID=A0ACB8FBR6_9SAUR